MAKNGKEKRRAIIYARFSPRPNAQECESCASQLKELMQYCTDRGYEVIGAYQDDALSGGDDWTERPGMFDAAEAAKRGYLFCVRAFDRLFRDNEKALVFLSTLQAKGVEVRSITEEVACGTSPVAKLTRDIFLALADYQRQVIKARTRAKMLQHQRNGRRMSKVAPWGTRVDPDDPSKLIQDPDEHEAIAMMIHLYRDQGYSLRRIARWLNENKVRCRGAQWSHVTVGRILRREGVR